MEPEKNGSGQMPDQEERPAGAEDLMDDTGNSGENEPDRKEKIPPSETPSIPDEATNAAIDALDSEDEEEEEEEEEVLRRPDYSEEIISLITSKISPRTLKLKLEDYHETDIASVLDRLTVVDRKKLYRVLDASMISDVFSYVDEIESLSLYLDEMDIKKAVEIVGKMEAGEAVDILRKIDRTKRNLIIQLLDEETKKDIALIASYDEDEIGSRMTTNYIEIRDNLSIKEAMHSLVEQAAENDNISTLYVVDEEGTFCGAIDLKDLIIARQGTRLDDLVVTSYPYVYGNESIDDCIETLKNYSEDSIPVLDNDNKMLGVITSQDIVEVVDDEMSEDYAKLAGLTAEEDLNEPVLQSVKKRIPWLIVLLGLAMMISTVVGLFETVVEQLTILMTFQALILGMAGNVGTQSLAVTIRVLMDENLTRMQKWSLIFKEVRVGFCNGLLLGVASTILIGLYIALIKGRGWVFGYSVSGCIGLSLLLAMTISSLMGTIIPLFFKKINVDPAVASGPMISTINDLVAVVSYYGLSWIFLIKIMHLG